jgi:hypothetical protein
MFEILLFVNLSNSPLISYWPGAGESPLEFFTIGPLGLSQLGFNKQSFVDVI